MPILTPSRELLVHRLYEAAELEHNLMCTYLYAAFSLKDGEGEGLSAVEAAAVTRWRRAILDVSIDEMGHLAAVWNITAALGAAPRFGRGNFPLDPGLLPAGVVVKLTPFNAATLQHFVHLERPEGSDEPDGEGFKSEVSYTRGFAKARLTPMAMDYDTVGRFYAALSEDLRAFVARVGEDAAFCGGAPLQLPGGDFGPSRGPSWGASWAKPVICAKTALAAFDAIVWQGEGAPSDSVRSHFQRFKEIKAELAALQAANPAFQPAFPVAHNPVLRPPIRREGRVWLEDEEASATVDLANTAYALMLRLMAYSYAVPAPRPEKMLAIDLSLSLMRAMTLLAERAARLPAGPSNPQCNAGMSFSALRDAGAFVPGPAARRFFTERLGELSAATADLAANGDARVARAAAMLRDLNIRAGRGFAAAAEARGNSFVPLRGDTAPPSSGLTAAPPVPVAVNGVDEIEGKEMTLLYEGKKCIHARFCVTGAPKVFRANVQGPWIHPDAMAVDRLVEIAHACPSGAIRYRRKDGHADETPPPVNLIAIREAGPYAVRAEIELDGERGITRCTLCRCGASKNKPFCDGSHHDVKFAASGEPATGKADMLSVRDGVLAIDPETDGPLQVRGNLEITSGTGRVVARVTGARLCRCGGSATKPFCDGTHARIGFRSI